MSRIASIALATSMMAAAPDAEAADIHSVDQKTTFGEGAGIELEYRRKIVCDERNKLAACLMLSGQTGLRYLPGEVVFQPEIQIDPDQFHIPFSVGSGPEVHFGIVELSVTPSLTPAIQVHPELAPALGWELPVAARLNIDGFRLGAEQKWSCPELSQKKPCTPWTGLTIGVDLP